MDKLALSLSLSLSLSVAGRSHVATHSLLEADTVIDGSVY